MTKRIKTQPTPEAPTALALIEKALTTLEIVHSDVTQAVKLINNDSHYEMLTAYTRTALADVVCATGRLVFLRDKLTQQG